MEPTPATTSGRVVVGVDHTAGAEQALAWACAFAKRRALPLHVVTCAEIPVASMATGEAVLAVSAQMLDETKRRSEQVNEQAVAAAREAGLVATGFVTVGSPVSVLREQAHAEDVLVVGAAENGFLAGLLGTVPTAMVHQSKGVVVVVRGDRVDAHEVVVGVDGSECASAALAWATTEAARQGVALREVTADPSPSPAENLIAECRPDDLVVVGSHGHGALRSIVLGSVSRQVVQHALCTVAVVHCPDRLAD